MVAKATASTLPRKRADMALTVSQGFAQFLEQLTPLQSHRDAAASHRARVETSLKQTLSVHLMRETGSFHHGTGVRNYSDVDVLVSIANAKPGNSDTVLSWVKSALSASFPWTVVRISRPAVVVEFAGGDETWEVIPGFIKSISPVPLYDIPGAASGWIESAPTAHLDYVNECNRKADVSGGAKKLARLVKAWKYYCQVPISSFYLEMRAAQHIAGQPAFIAVWDMCLLLESLQGRQLAAMNDPKGVTSRFYPCSSDYRKGDALSKLNTAATRSVRHSTPITMIIRSWPSHILFCCLEGTFRRDSRPSSGGQRCPCWRCPAHGQPRGTPAIQRDVAQQVSAVNGSGQLMPSRKTARSWHGPGTLRHSSPAPRRSHKPIPCETKMIMQGQPSGSTDAVPIAVPLKARIGACKLAHPSALDQLVPLAVQHGPRINLSNSFRPDS